MPQFCEMCGQPASRTNPVLCAECYYKYWAKNKSVRYPEGTGIEIPKLSHSRRKVEDSRPRKRL